MSAEDLLEVTLRELGGRPDEDALRSVDELLRKDSARAAQLVDRLLAAVARESRGERAARGLIALGLAYLASRDAKRAREHLLDGLGLLPATDVAASTRGTLALARAELALGDKEAARGLAARSTKDVLALGDEPLAAELAGLLRRTGESVAADVIDHARIERRRVEPDRAEERLQVLARLAHALNSSIAGTAESLYTILRAVLEESGAERGFIMLHDAAATLRFEFGVARDGRQLGPPDFAFSTTIVEKSLEEGRAVLVPDLAATLPFAQASSARDLGLSSALCAPMRIERRRPGSSPAAVLFPTVRGIAGVLYVDSTSKGFFGERDARFFEVLADYAVLAVRAARTTAALEAAAKPAASTPRRVVARAPAIAPEDDTPPAHSYEEILTRDPGMRSMLRLIDRVAPSDASVLIRGESGTGKELVARALHRHGNRASGPFVAIDCGAIQDDLVKVELFGHEAGAYTDAGSGRAGLLERAHGGTLFLDELGEMSPSMQVALLRSLQEGEVRRVGGDRPRRIDVRLVAATHRDLRAMVERGELRHDLLFRIAVVEIRVPPLRERPGDIPLLVESFLRRGARAEPPVVEPAALARLLEHGWPGNVRELENVIDAASLAARGTITLADVDAALSTSVALPAPKRASASGPLEGTIESIERRAIAERLALMRWNQVQAARSLGMDRRTLHRKIVRYGIVRGRD